MKFICDDNLGRLTRHLRTLGFDTSFAEPISDSELLRVAASEERFLLTRDRKLVNSSHPFGMLLIEMDDPMAQLRYAAQTLNLPIETKSLFSRCSRCNALCHEVDKENVVDRVFPYVLRTQDKFMECPSCRRLYWRGTHYRRLIAQYRKMIPQSNLPDIWPDI